MTARRPTRLKIGWATWSVTYLSTEAWASNPRLDGGNAGETHTADHTIFIRLEHPSGKLDDVSLKEIVLHEILHAVVQTTSVGYTPIKQLPRAHLEEAMVAAMSGTLLAVLRDNPALTRWLLDG